jgi:NitT/TauT family transport system substrate-binding protein
MVMPGMVTENVKSRGLGTIDQARLQKQIEQVTEAYGLSNPPTHDRLFTAKFMPPQSERMLQPGN